MKFPCCFPCFSERKSVSITTTKENGTTSSSNRKPSLSVPRKEVKPIVNVPVTASNKKVEEPQVEKAVNVKSEAKTEKKGKIEEEKNESDSEKLKNEANPIIVVTKIDESSNKKDGETDDSSNKTSETNLQENEVEPSEISTEIDEEDPQSGKRRSSAASTISDAEVIAAQKERRDGIRERISIDIEKEIVKHEKDKNDELLIKQAIQANEFLRNVLTEEDLQEVIDAMYFRKVEAGEVIIKQGDTGMAMFVSAKGTFKVIIGNNTVNTLEGNTVFGELAILYNAKRLATIQAAESGHIWVLDRHDFQQITLANAIKEQGELLTFLKDVPRLNKASEQNLKRAANLLKREYFQPGKEIVTEGEPGDKFYIIRAGTVTVYKKIEGLVATLTRGQYFGERALLEKDIRQATVIAEPPGVECLTLNREDFNEYFGDIKKFIHETLPKPTEVVKVKSEYDDVEFNDLIRVSTLGVGGFGRVELVQHKTTKAVFALKYLKKIEMLRQHQTEHVFNEKKIQMSCNSMFIAKLYKTFRDSKYLCLLMECCLGGDLWTLLQKQKNRSFEENGAKFLAACVLEALAYLHKHDYIYRDLKPENLLIDKDGYVKLTDFGFAKLLDQGKTYTFAGTPEYVAPEIVLHRGHDKAVDYWAFGIFIYELLVGRTPFRTNDSSHMRTYNLILNGIDHVNFPTKIPKNAQLLIKKLCRPKGTDRLGCKSNGVNDIKQHKWFQGFDWEKLNERKIKSPYVPKLKGPTDCSHFDKFEEDQPTEPETSGWDKDF